MLDSQNVDTPAEALHPSCARSPMASIGWAVVIVATLGICYISHLGAIGLVGPDEPRYAWIARDMLETGDWVTPRLYGKPWFEKPPLFYWGAALSFHLLGATEAAARLPSAVSALLATVAMAWLAFQWYGAEMAPWLLLLLPTSVGMIGFSHAAATDMPFSAMFTLAMVCAVVVLGLTRTEHTPILPRTPWLALLLFGFFLGLAVLAKGPAALILSGGAIFFWALFTQRWRDALRLLHPVALVSFCATALPWYVLCAQRNPDFLTVFLVEHNFKRYLTPEFHHLQPIWFYLPVLLVTFLPWTGLLVWSLLSGAIHLWRARGLKESTWFLLCWALFCVLFFSLSRSKLPGYILPAVPSIGLLLSHRAFAESQTQKKSLRLACFLAAVCFFLLFGFATIFSPNMFRLNPRAATTAGLVLGLMGVSNLFWGIFFPRSKKNSLYFLGAALSVLPILIAVLRIESLISLFFSRDPSARTIARELQREKTPIERLAVANMTRSMQFSLNFYLHQEIAEWNAENCAKSFILTPVHSCRSLHPIPLSCESRPFDEKATGVFLYYVVMPGSALISPNGGEVQQEE